MYEWYTTKSGARAVGLTAGVVLAAVLVAGVAFIGSGCGGTEYETETVTVPIPIPVPVGDETDDAEPLRCPMLTLRDGTVQLTVTSTMKDTELEPQQLLAALETVCDDLRTLCGWRETRSGHARWSTDVGHTDGAEANGASSPRTLGISIAPAKKEVSDDS